MCTAHAQRAFHFDWLDIMIDVSSGDRKSVTFLSLLALLCGMNNFVQEELFILTIFTLQGNLRQKCKNPQAATSILPICVGTIPRCVLYRSSYQHTKFRTCMKTGQFWPFATLLLLLLFLRTSEFFEREN